VPTPDLALGPRLDAIAGLIAPGRPFADIGSDHGRLPTALVLRGVVPWALACDRAERPLARARLTARRNGAADRVHPRLGEGLAALELGEVETAVIAGMGGPTIGGILAAEPARARSLRRLILQPNHGHEVVRRCLAAHALALVDERLVLDGGRFYTVLVAEPGEPPDWDQPGPAGAAAWQIGPHLLRRGGPLLARHLAEELRRCEQESAALARAGAPDPARVAAQRRRREALAWALAKTTGQGHPGPA
jgi:tRNA (adenine22-N1)-methyltransferase